MHQLSPSTAKQPDLRFASAHPASRFPKYLQPSQSPPSMIPYALLLLSDSALPLGSFAFSSSLESYAAHHRTLTPNRTDIITTFLHLSLHSTSTSILPFLYAAYRAPARAADLDDELDASTPCAVARRASTSQGRALLAVFEKSLYHLSAGVEGAREWVRTYKTGGGGGGGGGGGHFGVAWGLVCRALGVSEEDAAEVFVVNHCKAVLSAGVRLGLLGPYQAQAVLAMPETRREIEMALERGRALSVDEVGQSVPALDLYQGRHELLYSRVFNS